MQSGGSPVVADADIERLIEEARGGSVEALGRLLASFREQLAWIAEDRLGVDLRPKVGVSDLVQETFLEAQRDFAQFQGDQSREFRAWLRCLLLNNLLNQARKYRGSRKRQLARELAWHEAVAGGEPGMAAADTSPSQRAVRAEDVERLERAMSQLPEHYRQVIRLRNHQHLSFAQIGDHMERSEDAVRMLWARAFQSLARALDASP